MNWWKRDDELNEEIRAHLRMAARDRVELGESADAAEKSARRELGNELLIKEVTRDTWGWVRLEGVVKDLSCALRQMRRNPGFTLVAVLSLAIGIGANTAIFSIWNALLMRTLPASAPNQLFVLQQQSKATVPQRFSYPMFLRLRDAEAKGGVAKLAAVSRLMQAQILTGSGGPAEMAPVQLVSGEFFPLMGLSPAQGRLLTPADNQTLGGNPVAVISHGFWQRRFAGAPVIGNSIRVNGAAFTIVGIAPEGFRGIWVESSTDIWVPMTMQANVRYSQNYSGHENSDSEKPWVPQGFIDWVEVMVRTNPGTAPAAALSVQTELNGVFLRSLDSLTASLGAGPRRYFMERSLTLEPADRGLSSNLRQRFSLPLLAMMCMVAVVLLIACANTANLLLARATRRRREMAMRFSLGASRGRLIQQLLTESFLLTGIAAGIGLVLAHWGSDVLVRRALGVTDGPSPLAATLDGRVLAFTMGVTVLTGLLFGLAPAFRTARTELAVTLRGAAPRGGGSKGFRPAKLLVAVQVGLSLLVVFTAALFARSLHNLTEVNLGFDREHVVTAWINPRAGGFEQAKLDPLYTRLLERVRTVPGVRSAAIAMCGLVVECRSINNGFRVSGYTPGDREVLSTQYSHVTAGYFSTVGIPLVRGRDFAAEDRGTKRVIINEAFARRYFAGRNPVGERMGDKLESEIIGVVADARVNRVQEAAAPMAYFPLEGSSMYAFSLEVRSAGDPNAVAVDVRKAITEAEGNLPVERMTILSAQVDRSVNQERLLSVLAEGFGVLALGLACFGLYGVMSYAVTQRTSEIGLRMALGARPGGVLWIVLRESMGLVALGLAMGLPAVRFASRGLGALLYGVTPDVGMAAVAAGVLSLVAMAAGVVPAWRASRVSPMVALRHE